MVGDSCWVSGKNNVIVLQKSVVSELFEIHGDNVIHETSVTYGSWGVSSMIVIRVRHLLL